MAEKNFAITPSVNISRSKFNRPSTHKTSFNLGQIVPLYCDEVLPGDTRSIDVASLIRMSQPIAPILDDIEMELMAFWVPNRLVWSDWKEFMGESPTAGYSAWSGTYPYCSYALASNTGCLGDYLGLAYKQATTNTVNVTALPLRGYLSIYNRWFRDQNVEGPCFIDMTDGLDASTNSLGQAFNYNSGLLTAYKKSDYFTRALPYAQKGLPVTLPLGTTAPLITGSYYKVGDNAIKIGTNSYISGATSTVAALHSYKYGTLDPSSNVAYQGDLSLRSGTSSSVDGLVNYTNLVADLSSATAATINELREAFQLQKLLEHDSLYGTRYWEVLYGHFAVKSPDSTLQDPEYLGGIKFMINVEQVLSTAGYSSDASTTVGAPGANSVTGHKGQLFTKSFCEHGWLFVLGVARQVKHTYSQGIMPMWTRFNRFDYYWPEFANLGAQEIPNRAIYAQGTATDNQPFGYQEAWADYRYKPSIVSGILNPNRSSSLDFWTLAEKFGSLPTLSTSFLKETRDNLARALVSGVSGPDFIADFYFHDIAVRPMPLYSIPGLIDHH